MENHLIIICVVLGKSLIYNCNFIKNENLAQVFSCEFCEISKNTFLQNISGRLLLEKWWIYVERSTDKVCEEINNSRRSPSEVFKLVWFYSLYRIFFFSKNVIFLYISKIFFYILKDMV